MTMRGEMNGVIDGLIAANPDRWAQAKKNRRLLGWFVGKALQAMPGCAERWQVYANLHDRADDNGETAIQTKEPT